jgi:hypothetical protein
VCACVCCIQYVSFQSLTRCVIGPRYVQVRSFPTDWSDQTHARKQGKVRVIDEYGQASFRPRDIDIVLVFSQQTQFESLLRLS